MGATVYLNFQTAGNPGVIATINEDIATLRKLQATIDLLDANAVRTFRNQVAAHRDYAASINASALQVAQLDAMVRKFDVSSQSANLRFGEVDKASSKWRTGANSLSVLALTATGASRSLTGLAVALGTSADAIASVSGNARIAASAAVLGALATAAGIVFSVFENMAKKTRENANELRKLREEIEQTSLQVGDQKLAAQIQDINRQIDDQINQRREKHRTFMQEVDDTFSAMGKFAKENVPMFTPEGLERIHKATGAWQTLKEVMVAQIGPVGAIKRETSELNREEGELNRLRKERKELAEKNWWDSMEKSLTESGIQIRNLRNEIDKLGAGGMTEYDQLGKLTGNFVKNETDHETILGRERDILRAQHEERAKALTQQLNIAANDKEHAAEYEFFTSLLDDENERYRLQLTLLHDRDGLMQQAFDRQTKMMDIGFETNVGTQLQAHLDEIKMQEEIEKVTIGRAQAEQRAAAETKKAWSDAFQAQIGGLRSLQQVFGEYHTNIAKTAFNAIKNVKAIELGYIAIKDTILGFEAAADAVKYAAALQWSQAAIAGIAATKYFANAALAASEAGGGGGKGGGAGGGSGGAQQRESTRLGANMNAPASQGQGKIEIVIINQDASGRQTGQIRRQIQRLDDRNQPIRVVL